MILSLNLSRPGTDLSLHDDSLRLLGERRETRSFSHAEQVIPLVESLLLEQKAGLTEVKKFVTSSGPGSFTGLRVAYATLKAFSLVTGSPIEAVDGNEARALAWASRHPSHSGELHVFSPLVPGRTLVTRFRLLRGKIEKVAEAIESISAEDGIALLDIVPLTELFPLAARYLVEALPQARSRQAFTDFASLAEASPRYFGDSFAGPLSGGAEPSTP